MRFATRAAIGNRSGNASYPANSVRHSEDLIHQFTRGGWGLVRGWVALFAVDLIHHPGEPDGVLGGRSTTYC